VDGLKIYLNEISGYRFLTREEEVEIATRAKAGDAEAMETLVGSLLPYVVQWAQRYCRPGSRVDLDDLVQAGNLGLLNGIRKFDPARGHRLSTFATWSIRQSLQQFIGRSSSLVRRPINGIEGWSKDSGSYEERTQKYEQAATVYSLNGGDDSQSFDQIADHRLESQLEREAEAAVNRQHAEELLKLVNERYASVLRMRMDGLTLEECGKYLGVTRERVRQIEANAIAKIQAGAGTVVRPPRRCGRPKNKLVWLARVLKDHDLTVVANVTGIAVEALEQIVAGQPSLPAKQLKELALLLEE
jgi:RNA polymerase primary sigma factor